MGTSIAVQRRGGSVKLHRHLAKCFSTMGKWLFVDGLDTNTTCGQLVRRSFVETFGHHVFWGYQFYFPRSVRTLVESQRVRVFLVHQESFSRDVHDFLKRYNIP